MLLDYIDRIIPFVSYFLTALGIIIVAIYFTRKSLLKGYKDKYNLISRYEERVIRYVSLAWIVAFVIYPRSIVSEAVKRHDLVDFLIALILGLSLAFAIYYILKHYYPDYLDRRLSRLRYRPRMSPKTGKPMKLLTEEEEDVYLDEGMQAEEDVFSVDYDVWIDEESGYTQIEKYSGKHTLKQCSKCSYYTLKVEKEELLIAPSTTSSGELLKRYKCTYCGHTEKEIFHVAKLKE
jgi:hypothetical protein